MPEAAEGPGSTAEPSPWTGSDHEEIRRRYEPRYPSSVRQKVNEQITEELAPRAATECLRFQLFVLGESRIRAAELGVRRPYPGLTQFGKKCKQTAELLLVFEIFPCIWRMVS